MLQSRDGATGNRGIDQSTAYSGQYVELKHTDGPIILEVDNNLHVKQVSVTQKFDATIRPSKNI
jgi:hypothetical protein